jgi:hypothetical protein
MPPTQGEIIPLELEKTFQNVLKFQYPRLSAALCTLLIRVKPLHIAAAMQQWGSGSLQARAAGSLLVVNAHCMPVDTKYISLI